MTDAGTQKPLRVLNETTAGPYVRVLLSQLDELTRILDNHGLFYWVDENVTSWNDAPEVAVVHFGHNGDAALVQSVLDNMD